MDAKTAAAASIDDYIAAQASAVQPLLQRIRALAPYRGEKATCRSRWPKPCPTS
jgi:hypothetical protein